MIRTLENIKHFFTSIGEIIEALMKVALQSKFNLKLPSNDGNEMVFIANGPSLESALKKIREELPPKNIMVSNFFCKSDYFTSLKPNHYIVCDPSFIDDKVLTNSKYKKFYSTLYAADWKIKFFVPYYFKTRINKLLKELKLSNDNISIHYYNSVNLNGSSSFVLKLIKLKLGIPRPTTVAVPALMVTIQMGYKIIKIGGIDLNQHLDIEVTKDNIVQWKQNHFYDKEEKKSATVVDYSISEIFRIFYHYFYSFDIIANYAKKFGIQILNYSEDSFLDQFKKK